MSRRSALLIATDTYSDETLRRLRSPAGDVAALAQVLADPSIGRFDVTQALNEASHDLARRLDDFLTDRDREDVLLIYVSCHGIVDARGRLRFATTNTETDRLASTALHASFVAELMRDCRSRSIVLILDCCHSGAFARGLVAKAGPGVGIDQRFEGSGRVILTASNEFEYAFEGGDLYEERVSTSVFTHALVHGLRTGEADRDHDGRISVDDLYSYAFDRVRETTPHQTPGKWAFELSGEIFLASCPQMVRRPPEPFPSLFPALDDQWREATFVVRTALPGASREYLDVSADEGSLRVTYNGIRGEVRLPVECDPGSAGAILKDGILTITFPLKSDTTGVASCEDNDVPE